MDMSVAMIVVYGDTIDMGYDSIKGRSKLTQFSLQTLEVNTFQGTC